jgi:hypothetical protein
MPFLGTIFFGVSKRRFFSAPFFRHVTREVRDVAILGPFQVMFEKVPRVRLPCNEHIPSRRGSNTDAVAEDDGGGAEAGCRCQRRLFSPVARRRRRSGGARGVGAPTPLPLTVVSPIAHTPPRASCFGDGAGALPTSRPPRMELSMPSTAAQVVGAW